MERRCAEAEAVVGVSLAVGGLAGRWMGVDVAELAAEEEVENDTEAEWWWWGVWRMGVERPLRDAE